MEMDALSEADSLLEVAQYVQERSHNPYDEPAEGAAVLARSGDKYIAVPGVMLENGNYNNTRTGTEVAVSNALVRGYDSIEQLAVSRDDLLADPLQDAALSVCSAFFSPDTPVTVEEAGESTTYRFDTLYKRRSDPIASELAPDTRFELDLPENLPTLDTEAYRHELVSLARGNQERAYTPSSGYNVGAALLDADGTVHPGNNIEPNKPGTDNVAKKTVVHGEESAIMHWKTFSHAAPVALAVATADGGNCCGGCKQWMAEFFSDDTSVLNASADAVTERTYGDYDPFPFRLNPDL